jgi:hypothetical protein
MEFAWRWEGDRFHCDGKRVRMMLNQSFTGALTASAPALRYACACFLVQAFVLAMKRCI